MGKVFYAYAVREDDPDSGAEAFLNLPATPYELLDALDKLRLDGNGGIKFRVDEYYRFSSLAPFLNEPNDLYELNALAQRLSELDDRQTVAFEGLLEIESQILKETPHGLPDLIDIAYSTDCCHVVDGIEDDAGLGRFCAKNGFVPDADALPDAAFDLLDFERIGQEHRCGEGGVLVECDTEHPGGYVERHSDLVRVYQDLDLKPKLPDYTILLELTQHGEAAMIKLPAGSSEYKPVLEAIGAKYRDGVGLRCLDCRVPSLIDMISEDGDISNIVRLADALRDMDPTQLTGYKAVLEATGDCTMEGAFHIAQTLDDYLFTPEYATAADMAKDYIRCTMGEEAAEDLLPFVDLEGYGQVLMQNQACVLTGYGMVSRKDGQSLQPTDPIQGGMEMM